MPFSTSMLNKLAELGAGKAAAALPAVYVALSTTTPAAAGTGVTEPSGNGYARVLVPTASLSNGSNGVVTNSAPISFPAATGNQGTVTHAVAFDASTGGNMLWFSALPVSKTITSGDQFNIAIGSLTVTFV